MKQTAVEFLIVQIYKHWDSEGVNFEKILEQAKEMEKRQIVDAYNNADSVDENNIGWISAERYYNETFKK
jgi:hypothetical protein